MVYLGRVLLKSTPTRCVGWVKGLTEGGCPPGLVLIDDGWQSICHDDDPITDQEGMNRTSAGEQMPCRLIKFEENHKFRNYSCPKIPSHKGMGAFVSDLKNEFKSVEHVYVWHALCGYWGGVRPNVPQMPECRVIRPTLSPGLVMTMQDLAVDKIVNNGVGLVPPEKAQELFEGLHSHLKSAGIDGVKVDVIHLLEMLSEDYGGRVELARAYFKALTASVRKHFQGNGVIASMEHCNDFMFLGTEVIALGRVGDPNGTFWLQGCHMVHCAYNSLWMGNFIHPDWDMFQSTHPCAEFHAASRAISGGPIYVSDSVGKHDFELLKRLVLPDGTVLRCQHYALPTRDCLFEDPLHDGKTMLKIWNLKQVQRKEVKPLEGLRNPRNLPPSIRVRALHRLPRERANKENGAICTDRTGEHAQLRGSIESLEYDSNGSLVRVGVRGAGEMRILSSKEPLSCMIDGVITEFDYDENMVVVQVPWPNSSKSCVVEYAF
ncbi:UNVERIFIED_CONTAM: Galactinol--sucrose galactosyltransferase [Sesamum angustifolium]|uniref:Galactinol--sucrose galactosyltransferase n=1 Tax=Sesamum angustifolium TaxID=2727405 RepID=A0AAW2LHV5_9LAMI